jgi:putative toxin-antitoxin system antitoxin component (TIGR02293 family)
MTVSARAVANVLGGERTLRRRVRTVDDLRRTVEDGLPVAALDHAAAWVAGEGAAATELKHRIVPKTTLHRRGDRLSLEESQRLERLARMAAMAEDVWEDKELAHEFLLSAQPQLGGERPIDLARSELGARQVEMVLFAIEYALPA